ncbi:hypothetical protein H3C61_04245 [Candidatus Gracilibacteria bacterium]|nr:hypothetical protein [Candidatus Gracilibacteria bacterium]
MEIIVYIIILLILIFGIYIIFIYNKPRKLTSKKIKDFQKKLKQIEVNISSKEKIIDYDKLYHKILLEAGYVGDFGSILKQKPIIIDDLNKIWELHKIRNKLVHDFFDFDENFLLNKQKVFLLEIKKLLDKLK